MQSDSVKYNFYPVYRRLCTYHTYVCVCVCAYVSTYIYIYVCTYTHLLQSPVSEFINLPNFCLLATMAISAAISILV